MSSFIKIIPGRVVLSLLLLVLIYSVANYFMIKWIVTPKHAQVERALINKEMARFVEALLRETEVLANVAHDWAAWDDTYKFIKDRNPEYITSNLLDSTLIDSGFNVLFIFRLDGSLAWSRALDLETRQPIQLEELPPTGLPPTHPLLRHKEVNSAVIGLQKTTRGVMLIASHPIVSSENMGPIVGTLMFGRLLTERVITKLREQTKVNCRFINLDDQKSLAKIPIDLSAFGPQNPFILHYKASDIAAYSLLADYLGSPQWLLEVHTDRLLTSHTRDILNYVLISNSIIGFFTLLLFLLLYKMKIRTATSTFRGLIDKSMLKNPKERRKYPMLQSFSTDEFSKLGHDLRSMIAGFEQTEKHQKNLITQQAASRRQLNTILVREIKARLKIEGNLHKVQEDLEKQVNKRTKELLETNSALKDEIEVRKKNEIELKQHRRRLRALSSELMEMEDRERRQLASDLHDQIGQSLSVVKMYVDALIFSLADETNREKLQQIASIVDQTVQDVRTLTFELSPPVLYELGLEAALEWLAEEFQKKYGLGIFVECGVIPKSATAAFLALIFRTIRELLINVVRHAEADSSEVRVSCEGKDIQVTVTDNGLGMSDLENPSSGFGLFSIRERTMNIGGRIVIDSGKGKGTTITLTLPIQEDRSEKGK
ncbi:CHASE4 domain-containing protein [Desulforhopalus sp. IMCC35007]|uniref:sensor histidine kinase n=1 Tax=Desulforhopalus sp. IMCC35007 TaxID=2569543 RepID=UPI0010AE3FB3|nr:CHASE4 domain-containing protein [Desulforhopalus sp. IMCC35007]TKB11382.1 hypothetical protein FCL48_05100 [Desulforhopalus sp. IMCC35007]